MSISTQHKNLLRARRAKRVRARIKGTAEKPRLCVFRSLKHISAQIINDVDGLTLVSASDLEIKAKKGEKPLDLAAQVGLILAEKAKTKDIKTVVFDRGAYRFHGRLKALANSAREGGLEF